MYETATKSIMEMNRGAFLEQIDYGMAKVIENILDPNTKATGKRRLTVTMELAPDDLRRQIAVNFSTKLTLTPTNPLTTSLYVIDDSADNVCVVEMVPQIPGQMEMDGAEQERPLQLKIIKSA